MREKINGVSLFGKINLDGEFVGDNRNIYDELFQMRENDLRELELLILRVKEMISKIELMQIQANPGTLYDFKKEPDGVRPGSLRSKGTTLLIINGEFVDEVDDFASGQRRIKENTTITIMDPLSESSGSTRSIEYLSNTTVAILDEPFPEDIDEALAYDIKLKREDVESDYMDKETSQFTTWVDSLGRAIANTTHYMHPGYRVREYKAKANTISVIMPNDSSNEYDTIPVWDDSAGGLSGKKRTVEAYPAGTIIKLNGVVPASEGFVMSDEGTEVFGLEETPVASWMAIGASKDDKLIVDFGNDTVRAALILDTIGDEHVAISEPFKISDNAGIEQFKYHENWEVDVADATRKEQNRKDDVQKSRNKFLKYLGEINDKADEVYVDLQTLQDKTWPETETIEEESSSG